ncbi:MAG TPA: NHLP family bacteriocin export ABC transporter peptidase/permease/ATPase subunit, partial [Candidatus Tectomicrobia bacterium]
MEAVECGAAALGIILGYYGRVVPLAELRRECGVSRDGSTAANVLKAAQHYGLRAAGFSLEVAALQQLLGPTIIFWNFNHFVVVEGFHRQRVYLNDPESGPRTVSLEEFSRAFTGVVLVMEPGPDFTPGGQQPGTIHALHTRLQGSGSALAYGVMAGFLLVLPRLVAPVLTQVFVDEVLIEGLQDRVRPLLFGLLLTAVFHAGLLRLQLQVLRRLHRKLATGLSGRFLWHLLHLPSSFFAQRYAGEISQRVQLNERVAEVLSGRLATTVIDGLMMLVYASVMLQYDMLLTLLGVGCAMVNVVALRWLARRRVDANMRTLQEVGKLNGVAMAGLRGIETLKAAALESDFFARWAGYYVKVANAQQALQMTNQTLGVLPPLLSALATMLVLVLGGLRVIDGHLSLGMLVAFQSLMQSFLAPVNSLVGFGSTLQDLQGALQRLDDVLHNPAPAMHMPAPGAHSILPETYRFHGAVHVRNVTFGYSPAHPPMLENVSFTLQPGQRIALVGASGSGKSTLARLVCGLYEPWRGDILFDGIPRSRLSRQVLSHALAMVDQDIVLFAGTVRDNLTLWDTTVPGVQLVRACKDALIHDVVQALPGGYDGELLEGAANLSGGQRQRLEIARALVQEPVLLIMDEATSALDAETEYCLMQQLRKRGCTCLIVAHRLSTIRDCDAIIVLDHGTVVQQGTHAALLHEGGVYARLLAEAGEDSRVSPYCMQGSMALACPSAQPVSAPNGQACQRHVPRRHVEALAALAIGFDAQRSCPSTTPGPLLLTAARAVGEVLGVSISPPAPSEAPHTVKDPLEAIARASHLRLRRVTLTDHWWQRDCGPLIAYRREDRRPVALLPVSATRYMLFDPLHHTRTPVHAGLAATLAPEAYTLSRPFPNRELHWGDLLAFGLRGCGKDLRLALLSGIAMTLLGMLMPQATALFIDHAIPDADRGLVLQFAAALFAAACGQALFHLAQGVTLLRQSTTASATVQTALWDRFLTLPAGFFRQYVAGDLLTRVMAVSAMQRHLNGATLRTLCTSGLALLNLGLMLCYSVPLGLIAGVTGLVACLATGIAGALSLRQVRRLQHLTGALLGMTGQIITGVVKLQVAGAQERAFASWSQTFSQKQRVRQRLQGITDTMTVVNAMLPTVASVVLFWGALRVLHASPTLTAGTFVAFHAAFGLFIGGTM